MHDLFPRKPWDHQVRGVSRSIELIQQQASHCLTSPTGCGKSLMMLALINWAIRQGMKVSLYTNRILLTQQTMQHLNGAGISFGVRAATQPEFLNLHKPVQISSIQTEWQRCYLDGYWEPHQADLVLVDEAHAQSEGACAQVISDHQQNGATVIGVTATPLGISHLYPDLVIAGNNSEGRKCGALVPARMFAPSEMDAKNVGRTKTGEFEYGALIQEVWSPVIAGYVYDEWKLRNPQQKPALGYGPGTKEALFLAEQFYKRGVPCAYIDATDCWLNGEVVPSTNENRWEIIRQLQEGTIKIIWNRFVLREGIDLPDVYHLILATPIGSIKSFVQVVGRGLRRSPQTPDHVIISDHGGSWYRHFDPNDDVDWASLYETSDKRIIDERIEGMRDDRIQEPIRCPACGLTRPSGGKCPDPPVGCGFKHLKRSRIVIQTTGSLQEKFGKVFNKRWVRHNPQAQKQWDRIFWSYRKAPKNRNKTFRQARGWYYQCYREWPPDDLRNMPVKAEDWFEAVSRVPQERLIQ